jgi:DnaJ-domain-containing protein 1
MMGWLAWFYRKHLRQTLAAGAEPGQAGGSAGAELREEDSRPLDAYEVLGVERSASRDVIRAAYWARMNEYHPDKVAHLGEELQELAHEKSQEIQHAYRQLCR